MQLDQQQTNIDFGTGSRFGDTTKQKAAQTFKPSVSDNLAYLEFEVYKDGSPTDSLRLEIYSDNAGTAGTLLATSPTLISGADLSASDFELIAFNFLNGPYLTAETTYWTILSRTGSLDDANFYRYGYGGGFGVDRYTRGESFYYDGGSWVTNDGSGFTFDAFFNEYYTINQGVTSIVPSYSMRIIDQVTAY